MDFLGGRVQIFLGRQENGAADDLESVIIRFIDEAQFSLQVAVQELDNPALAAASALRIVIVGGLIFVIQRLFRLKLVL